MDAFRKLVGAIADNPVQREIKRNVLPIAALPIEVAKGLNRTTPWGQANQQAFNQEYGKRLIPTDRRRPQIPVTYSQQQQPFGQAQEDDYTAQQAVAQNYNTVQTPLNGLLMQGSMADRNKRIRY